MNFVAPPREPVPPTPLSALLGMCHGEESDEAARLAQWQSRGMPILDLRPPSHFASWRLRGRVSNVPWYLLADEGYLLPPREVAFAVLLPRPSADTDATADASSESAANHAGLISFQHLATVASSEMTDSGLAEPTVAPSIESVLGAFLGPRNPWVVTDIFVDSPSLRKAATSADLVDGSMPSSANVHHLWSPTPELLAAVGIIEEAIAKKGRKPSNDTASATSDTKALSSVPAAPTSTCRGSCLDLGCGAGRDSSFLALRGWCVLATDNMPKALARARKLAMRCGVGESSCPGNHDDLRSSSSTSPPRYTGSLATAVVDVRKAPGSVARALHAMNGSGARINSPVYHLELRASVAPCSDDASVESSSGTYHDAKDRMSDELHCGTKRHRSQELADSGSLGSFDHGVDLLLVGRFFYRPLLDKGLSDNSANGFSLAPTSAPAASKEALLTAREMVAPGGLVFWHHFRDGCQHHPLGHPSSDADIVRPGELLDAFAGWEVLLNDEEALLPDGRPMVTFIAQRPFAN